MTITDTTDYTSTQAALSRAHRTHVSNGNHTCMPHACPKCGAETWLSREEHVGGRGYIRFWHCEWCGHAEEARYYQYKDFYWCFCIPLAGQLTAVLAYIHGATAEAALEIGLEHAREMDRVVAGVERYMERAGIAQGVTA